MGKTDAQLLLVQLQYTLHALVLVFTYTQILALKKSLGHQNIEQFIIGKENVLPIFIIWQKITCDPPYCQLNMLRQESVLLIAPPQNTILVISPNCQILLRYEKRLEYTTFLFHVIL